MSNYKELKTISKKYQGKEVYEVAADLGICIKTEEDSKKDFLQSNPLKNRSAVLTFAGNQYVLYYKQDINEKFYILHELCHYVLKHNADGEYEESQSNILACMILISNNDLHKDVYTLSILYNIPAHIVYMYITYLKSNTNIYKKRKITVFTSFTIAACVLFVSGTLLGAFVINNKTSEITPVVTDTETTTELVSLTTQAQPTDNTVYITKSGTKYHKENCYYIKNSKTVALTVEQAEQQDYSPCAVCIGD